MMKNKLLICVLACFIAFVTSQMDYREKYTNTMTCKMGRLQSPVNLAEGTSSYNNTITPAYFNYLSIPGVFLDWIDNNRIVGLKQSGQGQLQNSGYMGLLRGGVLKQYALVGLEVYHPAEHYLNGTLGQVEIKLIHKKVLPFETEVNQWRRIPDANTYLIISLVYGSSGKVTDNGLLNALLSTWPGIEKSGLNNAVSSLNLNLNSFEVLQDKQFFFYEGSFTYAPCDETVNQIVYKDIFYASPEALNVLDRIYSKYANGIASKNITEYFGRQVFRNFANVTEASSSWLLQINTLLCIILSLLVF